MAQSTEVEYRALFSTTVELDRIKQLMAFLQVTISDPPTLLYDNLSTIALTTCNPMLHQRIKHIEINVHFVCERVAAGAFCLL